MSPEEVARAFSGHDFAAVFPHLAADVRWVSMGGSTVQGRDAVIEACKRSTAELEGVTTRFRRFVVVPGDQHVAAVDAVGEYTDADGQRSVVGSCDIYEFTDGELSTITSYAVELPATD